MEITQSNTFAALIRLSTTTHTLLTFNISEISSNYATPNVTKYQRCNFITEIHQFTIKIDKINTNLLFECVKIVEFNLNSHVFHVMYQETRSLNQDACFLNLSQTLFKKLSRERPLPKFPKRPRPLFGTFFCFLFPVSDHPAWLRMIVRKLSLECHKS